MKERGILFTAPMVRALLDGRKKQTRGIVKFAGLELIERTAKGFMAHTAEIPGETSGGLTALRCPYGVPGDLLWVREAWQSDVAFASIKPSLIPAGERFFYRAGGSINTTDLSVRAIGWRPGIHMPRWASRITLRVSEVRVERLQDISEEDAVAEGLLMTAGPLYFVGGQENQLTHTDPRVVYRRLWEQINGPGSWEQNPFVWALTFEVLK